MWSTFFSFKNRGAFTKSFNSRTHKGLQVFSLSGSIQTLLNASNIGGTVTIRLWVLDGILDAVFLDHKSKLVLWNKVWFSLFIVWNSSVCFALYFQLFQRSVKRRKNDKILYPYLSSIVFLHYCIGQYLCVWISI